MELLWILLVAGCIAGLEAGNSTTTLPYIIGDVIKGAENLTWNASEFNSGPIELILLYTTPYGLSSSISFGMINNTGSISPSFQPNLIYNASHLLIPNNSSGNFKLSQEKKSIIFDTTKYILFQPMFLNNPLSGFTIAKDLNGNATIIINGMIEQSIFNQTDYLFHARLANISKEYSIIYNQSLSISLQSSIEPKECKTIKKVGTYNVKYCPFMVNVTNTFTKDGQKVPLGYAYFNLLFGETLDSNYYFINGYPPKLHNPSTVFVYSSKNVIVNMENITNGQGSIIAYQARSLSFEGTMMHMYNNVFLC